MSRGKKVNRPEQPCENQAWQGSTGSKKEMGACGPLTGCRLPGQWCEFDGASSEDSQLTPFSERNGVINLTLKAGSEWYSEPHPQHLILFQVLQSVNFPFFFGGGG